MKNTILTLAFAFLSFSIQSQPLAPTEVPPAVHSAFKKANPAGLDAVWNRENTNYKVKYVADKRPRSATYTKSGTLVVNDPRDAFSILPSAIKSYIDKSYAGQSINKVLKITKQDGSINYNLEVNGTELYFDGKGNFIKAARK